MTSFLGEDSNIYFLELYNAGKIKTVKRQNKKKQEKTRKSPKGNRKICQNVDKKSTKFPVST